MKKFKLFSTLSLIAFASFGITSCNKNEYYDCPTGYTGDNCDYYTQDLWTGYFTGNETCTNDQANYTITVTAQNDILTLTISNIYANNVIAYGYITDDPYSIQLQSADPNVYLEGTATLNGNTIRIDYDVNLGNGAGSNSCTFVGSR